MNNGGDGSRSPVTTDLAMLLRFFEPLLRLHSVSHDPNDVSWSPAQVQGNLTSSRYWNVRELCTPSIRRNCSPASSASAALSVQVTSIIRSKVSAVVTATSGTWWSSVRTFPTGPFTVIRAR